MVSQKFKMKMDWRVKIITSLAFIILIGGIYFFFTISSASYLPAWLITLFIAVIALLSLSIPRYILVSQTSLEIHCFIELTVIPLTEIREVKRLSKREMSWSLPIPIIGAWGVFGYYGYYYNFRTLRLFKIYASRWNNFIQIETSKGDFIVISSQEDEELFKRLKNKQF